MTRSYEQYCALARALDHVGDRWTMLIVRELLISERRYSDLHKALPGIATNLLAERLRALQDDGVVDRKELPPPAASTVWYLTESGRELEEVLLSLTRWGARWMVQPRRGDTFRLEWLALALKAIFPNPSRGSAVTVDIESEGGHLGLFYSPGEFLSIDLGSLDASDVQLKASPPAILETVTGLCSISELSRRRGARVTGARSAISDLQKIIKDRDRTYPLPA